MGDPDAVGRRDLAAARYAEIRRAVYARVLGDAAALVAEPCALADLGPEALHAYARTWAPSGPVAGAHPDVGGWDWPRLAAPFRRRPDAIPLAVWGGEGLDVLAGLALGRPSRAHTHLALYYVKAAPFRPRPLAGRVLDLVILAGERYAQALGARHLRLIEPVLGLRAHTSAATASVLCSATAASHIPRRR